MEDKKPSQEAEDAVMQHGYPSPIVDSADAQYYQLAQDHAQSDHHQPGQPEHHGLPDMSAPHEHHEHHELHELHELQEESGPQHQQHSSRQSVSADDLQLAAQLTQGLAPMMAAVQDQIQGQQSLLKQEPQAQPHAEGNLQEQLETSLQSHEREMQDQCHGLPNHELQGVLSHPEHPQQHPHYPQNPPPPPGLPPHISMDHLPPPGHSQYQLPDGPPTRTRSKVSRACDECRRKKIKCDAQSEATEQPCSNCRRSNAQCLFSRVPQKRGPSKGYIKELADRINTLEGKVNTSVGSVDRRASSDALASPGMADDSRKRPFASISGDGFRMPQFAADQRPLLPYMPAENRQQNPASQQPSAGSNDLALKSAIPMQLSPGHNDASLQNQQEMMDGILQNALQQGASREADQPQPPELDDAAFIQYLQIIHPIFPVLASTKARVQSLLSQVPLTLQSAFCQAFSAMINPFPPAGSNQITGDVVSACRMLSEWDAERRPRSAVTDLVRLQILVMLVIAFDCHGIASVAGQLGGPSKAEILGGAVGLAYSIKNCRREVEQDPNPELDLDSDDCVALRTWWVLVMLDRWNAAGMATPTLISNDNVVIPPGLKNIVGDAVFALIRMSFVLGHLVTFALSALPDAQSPTRRQFGSFTGMAEMLRWVFPTDHDGAVLRLAYFHTRLLSELLALSRHRTANILQLSQRVVRLLAENHDLRSPLTHHFVALVVLALLELGQAAPDDDNGDNTAVRHEAAELIDIVLNFSMAPSPWNAAARAKLAKRWLAAAAPDVPRSQNLQHLADLATAVEGSVAAAAAAPASAGQEEGGETLVGGEGATAAATSAAPLSKAEMAASQYGDGDAAAAPGTVDVWELLRAGYLACFEEPNEWDA